MLRKQPFHHLHRSFHQRPAALVVGRHGNRHLAPILAYGFQVHHHTARIGIERLLALAALLQQAESLGIGERFAFTGEARGFECQVGQDFVEVVAAQIREAGAGHYVVGVVFHFDQRRIEGATTEVIHQQRPARLPLALSPLAMAELHARRGGLVEHAHHMEAGRAKSFRRKKPLVTIRIGRHADHSFHTLAAIE